MTKIKKEDHFTTGIKLANKVLSGEVSIESAKKSVSNNDKTQALWMYSFYKRLFEESDVFRAYELSWAFRNDIDIPPIIRNMLASHEIIMFGRLGIDEEKDLALGDIDPSSMFRPHQEF